MWFLHATVLYATVSYAQNNSEKETRSFSVYVTFSTCQKKHVANIQCIGKTRVSKTEAEKLKRNLVDDIKE